MLRFGTGGIPLGTPKPKDTLTGIAHSRAVGLEAMELAMVRSINISPQKAPEVRRVARKEDVALTVHAPYWISFTAPDPEKRAKSRRWLLDASRVGALCGARSVTFHAGSHGNGDREAAYAEIRRELEGILDTLGQEGVEISVRPETTGKISQFGDLEEILRLCRELPVAPCIDFAHLHARAAGGLNSHEEFCAVLDQVAGVLGQDALQDLHVHMSGILYSDRGERGHCRLEESDLAYHDVMRALKAFDCGGVVVSESTDKDHDALLLRDIYHSL